jgi:predicted DNA-binding transcriptional regulator YafY
MKSPTPDQAKFLKQLKLMNLLLPPGHTKKEMARRLEVSEKTITRYLHTFELANIDHDQDERKRYFLILPGYESKQVLLDSDEKSLLKQALTQTFKEHPITPGLLAKLDPIEGIIRTSGSNKKIKHSNYISEIYSYLKNNSLCELHYQTTGDEDAIDKLVYPIRFSDNFEYLIGYDVTKKKYLNLRLERILEVNGYNGLEKPPKGIGPEIEIDHFHMANNQESFEVKLGLTLLAKRILQEEFPITSDFVSRQDDPVRPHLYKTKVFSLLPVARFCMGFPTEVTAYEPKELIDLMEKKLNQIKMGH